MSILSNTNTGRKGIKVDKSLLEKYGYFLHQGQNLLLENVGTHDAPKLGRDGGQRRL